MTAPVLQFKRGALLNLPGLRAGEPALTTDSFDLYVGIDSTTNNNKFFGSHRYWTKETATTGSGIRFVERTDGGSNYIELKAPNTGIASNVTYVLPSVQGANASTLVNDGSGNLYWGSGSASATFTGITTFTDTTDSTTKDNGSVIFEGGIGIEKSVNIGGNLSVSGISTLNQLVYVNNGISAQGFSTFYSLQISTNLGVNGTLMVDGVFEADNDAIISGITSFTNTTDSVNINTGAVILDGGLAVEKSVNIGGNLNVAGVSTFVGSVTFQGGTINLGDSNTDDINVAGEFISNLVPNVDATYNLGVGTNKRWRDAIFSGIVTASSFVGAVTGTATTATRATLVDTTTADAGTFYPGLFVSSTGTASTSVYVDAGISYVSNTDTLTLTGDVAVNGGDVTTTATTASVFNTNATSVNAFGDATSLIVSSASGITTIRNDLAVGGDIKVGGNDIQASDGNTNITLTSNTLTAFAGDIKVGGNDIQASDGSTNITLTSNTLTTFAGDIKVGGNDIQASDGVTAISLSAGTGNVGVSSDLTVAGNLYVMGTTTEVETTQLKVEDNLIDLGLVQSGNVLVPPSADLNIDIGVLLNWYDSGISTSKKAAIYWDDSVQRIGIASDVSEVNGVLTSAAIYAPVEIGSLWVSDCAGTSQVISCTAGQRFLDNITVDAGTF